LELAIHTHPSYATAHENLGDIYAQMARRAYDKALQLDKTNTTAQSKLAMIKDLFSSPKSAASEPTKVVPTVVAKADPPKVAAATIPSAKVESKPPVESKPVLAPTSAPTAAGGNPDAAAITSTLEGWATAWAARDVAAYLAFYAPDFQVPDGLARAAWEAQRKARIEAAAKITVSVSNVKVTVSGNQATAVFRQSYKSDKLTSRNTKTVKLVRSGDKWLILAEHAKG